MNSNYINNFEYKKHLDLLRFLAISLVYLFHINKDVFPLGFVGVDIFFVISGYVITQSLMKSYYLKKRISFLEFYSKRFLRLFPALLAMVIFFLIIYLTFISWSDFELQLNIKSSIFSLFGISNFYYYLNSGRFDYFEIDDHSIPLIHTWSLGIEEQFYFLYPFIISFCILLVAQKKKLFNFICTTLLFFLAISLVIFINSFNLSHFYLPFARVWELLLGCLLFFFSNQYSKKFLNKKIYKFLSTFLIVIIITSIFFLISDKIKLTIVISTILISILILYKNIIPNFLITNQFISILGKSSYSIYLWHMPVIFFCNNIFSGFNFYFFSLIFTLLFSFLSFYIIEPLRYNQYLLKNIKYFFKFSIYFFVIIFVAVYYFDVKVRTHIFNSIVTINNFFEDINISKKSLESRLSKKWELSVDSCTNKYEIFLRNKYLNCIKQNQKNSDLYLLLGDSYGEHFINVLAKNENIQNLYYARLDNENFSKDSNVKQFSKAINNFENIKTNFTGNNKIVISLNYPKKIDFEKLENFVNYFQNSEVIFVLPHRVITTDKNCGLLNKNKFIICKKEIDQVFIENFILNIKKFNNTNLISFFEFNSFFCNKNICSNYLENKDMYIFTEGFNHLTTEFGNFISKKFNF